MSLLLFLLFGLVIGAIARFLVPGRESGGWVVSMAIGVLGSFVGGYLGQFLGFYRQGERAGFVLALLGAVLITIVYHAISTRRHVSA